MDTAFSLKGEERKTIVVIGDGAMTGGLAFEGINNAGVGARASAGGTQRQRHVDGPQRRGRSTVTCSP